MPTTPSTFIIAILLVLFTFKHYVADFLLQTDGMARGKEARSNWAIPLAQHLLVHAVMTLVITLAFAPRLFWLALVDFIIHGCIDRFKSLYARAEKLGPEQSQYWWLLGFDQFLHQMTNIALALVIAFYS